MRWCRQNDTRQGEFRGNYAGAMLRMENFARSPLGAAAALNRRCRRAEKGPVGEVQEAEIRQNSSTDRAGKRDKSRC
jgi:fructose 5-dehydrogenase large subunit